MKVGDEDKREVSEFNNELFTNARRILEAGCNLSHIGWAGVGDFVDWLEANYEMKKKDA